MKVVIADPTAERIEASRSTELDEALAKIDAIRYQPDREYDKRTGVFRFANLEEGEGYIFVSCLYNAEPFWRHTLTVWISMGRQGLILETTAFRMGIPDGEVLSCATLDHGSQIEVRLKVKA